MLEELYIDFSLLLIFCVLWATVEFILNLIEHQQEKTNVISLENERRKRNGTHRQSNDNVFSRR